MMRKVTIPIDVWVVEESDVAAVTEQARAANKLGVHAKAIADVLPGSYPVRFQTRQGPRAVEVRVVVGGLRLEVGAGLAIHPAFPGGIGRIDAILLEDAIEEPDPVALIGAIQQAAIHLVSADEVDGVVGKKAPAKKATKKRAKLADPDEAA